MASGKQYLPTGDVSAAAAITDNAVVRGADGVKGVQDSGVLIDDSPLSGASGTEDFASVLPTILQSGTAAYAALAVDVTETSTGSGEHSLLDLRLNGTTKFRYDTDGLFGFDGFFVLRQLASSVSTDIILHDSASGVGMTASVLTQTFFAVKPDVRQSGSASYTAFEVDVTETSTGSGTKLLLDLLLASASKFSVDNAGNVAVAGTVDGVDIAAHRNRRRVGRTHGWQRNDAA
jgi:hypothetical protein